MAARTTIRRAIPQGTTPRVSFQIVDEDGAGFQPDTLTLSIYDVAKALNTACVSCSLGLACPTHACTVTTVNERDAADVIASCDSSGNVELFLEPDDTEIVNLGACQTKQERIVAFTWTWSSGTKVGKHELVITIAADRAGLAA